MQARDILAGLMRARKFGADLIEVQRRRVDDPRARRAMRQQGPRDQRAGEQADGAARNEIAAAQRDEVRRARTCADEMDRHASRPLPPSPPLAMAQLAPAALMRGATSLAPAPAPASAAVSAIEGRSNSAMTFSDCVAASGAAARRVSGSRRTSGNPKLSRRRKEPGFDLLRLVGIERGGRAVAAGILERAPHQRDNGIAWAALPASDADRDLHFVTLHCVIGMAARQRMKVAESVGVRDRDLRQLAAARFVMRDQRRFGLERHGVDDEAPAGAERCEGRIDQRVVAGRSADEDRLRLRQAREGGGRRADNDFDLRRAEFSGVAQDPLRPVRTLLRWRWRDWRDQAAATRSQSSQSRRRRQ